ncbi:UNVERIFIED_CONTAM: Kinetochore protein NUF2 [Sesamum latifolium]|uniref:Kinetochore protein NUF2 n=1 Tax=Sesamum latifolium TaxID=2727402 RepID=A0AAW2UYY2_9LAMI
MDFNLSPQPADTTVYEGDAGGYYSWTGAKSPAIPQAKVAAGKLFLRPRGFAPPHYSDTFKIGYVAQGTCTVGLVSPNDPQEKVLVISKGDAIPVHIGAISWWFNGGDSNFTIIFLGESSQSYIPGQFDYFFLTGPIGVLAAFSPELITKIFHLKESETQKLVHSQANPFLVKLGTEINMPSRSNCDTREYVFNLDDLISSGVNYAEISVENFPLLDKIGLSASLVKLDPNSVLNPTYNVNGSEIIYVLKGSGRVQIMGTRVLDADVQEDEAFVVPKFFAATQLAGEHGLKFFSLSTSSRPIVGQLAGKESAWKALSSPVLQAALNARAQGKAHSLCNQQCVHIANTWWAERFVSILIKKKDSAEMSKFEYPRLPRHEIIAVLADSQIATVSEADLLHPDPDLICNLYTHIFLLIDTLQEDQGQMEFGALELLENPDHHVHSVQVMNLYNKIRELVAAVNCPKAFTPKDLIKPEPERTELFLSAFLIFTSTGDDLDHFEERELAAKDRMSQLNAEIAECEELREREVPLVQEINSKVKELHQTVSGLNKHQMTLKTSIKQLKEKAKEMDEKISEAEFALVQSVQENANLRSKIVQSPDKLQRALEEKRLVQIETKNAERAAVQAFQDKTATLEAYAKACKKMSKHFAQMQAVQEQVNSAKSVDKDVKVLKSKLSDEGILIKSLEAKLVELQSIADQLKEFRRQLEKETALKHEEVTKELNNVKLEVGSKRQALEVRHRQVESLVAEADAIISKKKIVKEEGEATMQELGRKCEEIVAEFNNYSKLISNLVAASEAD